MLTSRCSTIHSHVVRESNCQRHRILTSVSYIYNAPPLAIAEKHAPSRSSQTARGNALRVSSINTTVSWHPIRRTINTRLPNNCILTVLSFLPASELAILASCIPATEPDKLRMLASKLLAPRLVFLNEHSILNTIRIFASRPIKSKPCRSKQPSDADYSEILLDVTRTFRMVESQNQLARLLKQVCTEVECSYVQGMNMVVACCLKLTSTPEEAYMLCILIFKELRYSRMLDNGLAGIERLTKHIDKRVRAKIPRLWNALDRNDLDASLITTKWLVTLFSQSLSRITIAKLWMLFFVRGWKLMVDTACFMLEILFQRFEEGGHSDIGLFVSEHSKYVSPKDEESLLKALATDRHQFKTHSLERRRQGIKVLSSTLFR